VSNHTYNDKDYVLIKNAQISKSVIYFIIEYRIVTLDNVFLEMNLMDAYTNEWITGSPNIIIKKTGIKKETIPNFIILTKNFTSSFYLDVSLVPLYKDWNDRITEDRIYFF
jgi:hypothetical protein